MVPGGDGVGDFAVVIAIVFGGLAVLGGGVD